MVKVVMHKVSFKKYVRRAGGGGGGGESLKSELKRTGGRGQAYLYVRFLF